MLFSAQGWMLKSQWTCSRSNNRIWVRAVGLFFICCMVVIEFSPFLVSPVNAQQSHVQKASYTCTQAYFSSDGNPYTLCPGPYPTGGNCVWWAWEQWHLLNYNLPSNWGNAAEWAIDAQGAGLAVGTTPRLGSIAVFPIDDGYWATSPAGHVAFVTAVSNDSSTFNVTFQSYGDSQYMYNGNEYSVSLINSPQYQNGQLRFIYFPQTINEKLFAQLPGINGMSDPSNAVVQANNASNTSTDGVTNTSVPVNGTSASTIDQQPATYTSDRIALGLSPSSSDQEFNADFTGMGTNSLLLYNRQQGSLQIYKLNQQRVVAQKVRPRLSADGASDDNLFQVPAAASPIVTLGDAITPAGMWGSSLNIYVGNFSGGKASELLLYDRAAGTIQLLSFTTDFHIKKHVTISDIGTGWDLSVGRFNGKSSGVFLYKRYALATSNNSDTPSLPDVNAPTASTTSTVPGAVAPPVTPTVKASPTSRPAPSVTATPKLMPTPAPVKTATPKPVLTVTPVVTPSPAPTPVTTAIPAVTPSPTSVVTPSPVVVPTPTPTPTPASKSATATSTAKATPANIAATKKVSYELSSTSGLHEETTSEHSADLSGTSLADWEMNGRSANVMLLDFHADFSIRDRQMYTLWHANWEVYVGRFVNAQQDGIFLYDRTEGEGRMMDFDQHLLVNDYHELHNLGSNWVVYSGDFTHAGRSQLLLYDPGSGGIHVLQFNSKLSLTKQKTLSNVGTHQVLYVGHFGLPTLSVMLYDVQNAQSTFLAFDQNLSITHQYLIKTWDQSWQILVGNFVNLTDCAQNVDCAKSDTLLVLNRQTGQLEQYVFSFGREFTIYDNRIQGYLRDGVPVQEHVQSVDTTLFSLVDSLSTPIKNEELY